MTLPLQTPVTASALHAGGLKGGPAVGHKTSQSRDSHSPSSGPEIHITNPYECYWPKFDTRSVKPLAGSRGGSAIIPRGPPFAQAPEGYRLGCYLHDPNRS